MDYTFIPKGIKNKTKVEDITIVLYGEHPTLNDPGFVTPCNLGKFTVSFEDYKLVYDEKLDKALGRALRCLLKTYIKKQSDKEKEK